MTPEERKAAFAEQAGIFGSEVKEVHDRFNAMRLVEKRALAMEITEIKEQRDARINELKREANSKIEEIQRRMHVTSSKDLQKALIPVHERHEAAVKKIRETQ
jgi:hypothetical protein